MSWASALAIRRRPAVVFTSLHGELAARFVAAGRDRQLSFHSSEHEGNMNQIERRSTTADQCRVDVQTRANGKQTIAGYAAVFYDGDAGTEYRLSDAIVERISPGAFDRAIREGHDVRALLNHEADNLLGRTASGTCRLSVDRTGLKYEIDCDPEDPDHQRVLAKIKRGDLTGSSFAFRPLAVLWEENEGEDSVRWITDLVLFDVGPVTYPAYKASTTGLRDGVDLEALTAELQRSRDLQKVGHVQKFVDYWREAIDAEAKEQEHDWRSSWLKLQRQAIEAEKAGDHRSAAWHRLTARNVHEANHD